MGLRNKYAKDCCCTDCCPVLPSCKFCGGSCSPPTWNVVASGFVDGTCPWSVFNGSFSLLHVSDCLWRHSFSHPTDAQPDGAATVSVFAMDLIAYLLTLPPCSLGFTPGGPYMPAWIVEFKLPCDATCGDTVYYYAFAVDPTSGEFLCLGSNTMSSGCITCVTPTAQALLGPAAAVPASVLLSAPICTRTDNYCQCPCCSPCPPVGSDTTGYPATTGNCDFSLCYTSHVVTDFDDTTDKFLLQPIGRITDPSLLTILAECGAADTWWFGPLLDVPSPDLFVGLGCDYANGQLFTYGVSTRDGPCVATGAFPITGWSCNPFFWTITVDGGDFTDTVTIAGDLSACDDAPMMMRASVRARAALPHAAVLAKASRLTTKPSPHLTLPCIYLGGATGEKALCPSCVGHVEVKTFACSLHGQCSTHKPLPGLACCQTCPDYTPVAGDPHA